MSRERITSHQVHIEELGDPNSRSLVVVLPGVGNASNRNENFLDQIADSGAFVWYVTEGYFGISRVENHNREKLKFGIAGEVVAREMEEIDNPKKNDYWTLCGRQPCVNGGS